MVTSSRAAIEEFLASKRIAFVGISSRPKDFSRTLYRDLRARGYELIPVNPSLRDLDGEPCYPRVSAVNPPVEAVLLMTSVPVTEEVVADCASAGVKRVWMYRGVGQGAVSPRAVEFCRNHGITVVAGECPYMFLPNTGWFHGVHGFLRKLTGSYPA